ncbi:MAG: hypothetical protein WDN04_12830 [Rhodospirillales bacterium]
MQQVAGAVDHQQTVGERIERYGAGQGLEIGSGSRQPCAGGLEFRLDKGAICAGYALQAGGGGRQHGIELRENNPSLPGTEIVEAKIKAACDREDGQKRRA